MGFSRLIAIFSVLAVSIPCLGKDESSFLLINGGSSDFSNYSVHEADIRAFNELFGNRSRILNANGIDSYVVPIDTQGGVFQRDSSGWVVLKKTTLGLTQRATKSEFSSTIENLAALRPKQLTVVYGDHGSSKGISLWNKDLLNSEDIRTSYSKLPDTVVRSIHLHCYGGAAVVDPNRKIPNTPQELTSFLKSNYLPSKCALTLSAETELGQYYSWTDKPGDNSWSKLFNRNKTPSLISIKNAIAKDHAFNPSPSLTSDYLLKDAARAICADTKNHSSTKKVDNTCDEESQFNEIFKVSSAFRRELCASCLEPKIEVLDNQYREIELTYNDLEAVRTTFQYGFMKKKYPGQYQSLVESYQKYEKALAATTQPNRPPDLTKEIDVLFKDYSDKTSIMNLSFADREDSERFFETLDSDWMNQNKERFPHFARFYYSQQAEASSKSKLKTENTQKAKIAKLSPRELRKQIWLRMADLQSKRKAAELKRQESCRAVAEPMLVNSRDTELRKVYESIKSCEKSIIN